MNGPQHYAEAERLLVGNVQHVLDRERVVDVDLIDVAQVHATLALAAAIATLDAQAAGVASAATGRSVADSSGWYEVLGEDWTPHPSSSP